MKYGTMLPIAGALTLALVAGCERRDDTTGATRTTSATPSQMDDMIRDAAGRAAGAGDTAGVTDTTATTGATVEQPLDEHDREFLTKAASASMAEIALATTASQKAAHADVKSFADRMLSDHNKASDELKALAAKKGVVLPVELGKDPKSEQDKLSKMTGNKFDKEYAEFVIKDDEHDLKDFQKAAKDAKDPDVKAWAAKMVPILEDHVNAAKKLEPKVKR